MNRIWYLVSNVLKYFEKDASVINFSDFVIILRLLIQVYSAILSVLRPKQIG